MGFTNDAIIKLTQPNEVKNNWAYVHNLNQAQFLLFESVLITSKFR